MHAARLRELGAFLVETRAVWWPRPFAGEPLTWTEDHPAIVAWADGLSGDDVEALQEADLDVDGVPDALRRWARRCRSLVEVDTIPPRPSGLTPAVDRPGKGVRGRKWTQVHAFGAVARRMPPPTRWIEWCSGKAHLGLALHRATGIGLTALEVDPALCAVGRAASAGDGDVSFTEADVRDPAAAEHVPRGATILGLHACGELSDALMRAGVEREASLLAAPCCPQKRRGPYRPMSAAGRATGPALDRPRLLLAVSGEHVGGARIRRLRRRALVWRTAFSALIGETYHPLPSLPDSAVQGDFRAFAEHWAAHEGRALPARWDEDRALAAAATRVERARALGLVRAPFRAALELWTVLDRAAWLEERGRAVDVARFCPRSVTPRNLVVRSVAGAG